LEFATEDTNSNLWQASTGEDEGKAKRVTNRKGVTGSCFRRKWYEVAAI